MTNPTSRPRGTDMLSAMIKGYAPAIEKALDGKSPDAPDVLTTELRDLLRVWQELRDHLAQGHEI